MYAADIRKQEKETGDSPLSAREFSQLLQQVNNIRIALLIGEGKLAELPSGKVGDPHQCVLARAFSSKQWEATVEPDYVELTWHGETGKVDAEKLKKALEKRGFTYVEIEDRDGLTPRDWKDIVEEEELTGDDAVYRLERVSFDTTELMHDFIFAFDERAFPWLILES